MFRSLHMKLMLIMTLLIVSLMTVVGAFLVNSVSGYYLNQFYSQMQVVFQNDADFFHDLETAGPEEENGARQIDEMLARNGIRLDVTDRAVDWLSREGYDPMFGARPVKRTLQRYLVNELSKEILSGNVDRNSVIAVDAGEGGLVFGN